ncbi:MULTISPECIES: MDR family MFS transporter [unclassified Gordonia (in: high G+C Gram-positive bacteria)]|uniref:MDR family MFS transporter n=1 Tax=unclassified Gordonia (in: high G+C Gram-positive bacteria) TaxID=2657482 RepID=UPI0009AC785C|nr:MULTISPECIES: MDR family MFS transporter [unclassified Gordonia (in: high G+C Gram-positive bacteria)]MDF3283146.1 MDR family MFS transporter [Gordonia sp. N1V]OPX14359.1 MFS transporter [Gordonia sp. i37]
MSTVRHDEGANGHETVGETPPTQEVPREVRRVAIAVIVGLVAPILDTTIVTIALDALSRDLHATVSTVQWVSTGYLLALAVAVPLAGWAATRFGSRAAWTGGLVLFLAGSVMCAASWNIDSLIAFRVIQGFGAGLIMPLMTSILVAASGGVALGRLVAMVSLPTALGPILGPVVGGIILNWLDWRWLFLVNVPLCIAALILARRIPVDRSSTAPLDVLGLLLLAPGLAALLLGLSNAHNGIGQMDVIVPVAAGVVLTAAFTWHALRRNGVALVNVGELRRRSVSVSSLGLCFFGIASFGAMFLMPLYFQQVRGDSVLQAALVLIPQGVGALATRSLAGRFTDTIGARWVAVTGFAVVAAATVPFAVAGDHTNTVWLMVVLLVRGFGLGTLLSPLMSAGFIGLPGSARHDVSMLNRTFQQVGGSFGTALLAVVLTARMGGGTGFHDAFWWAAGLAAVGAAVSLLLPDGRAVV